MAKHIFTRKEVKSTLGGVVSYKSADSYLEIVHMDGYLILHETDYGKGWYPERRFNFIGIPNQEEINTAVKWMAEKYIFPDPEIIVEA